MTRSEFVFYAAMVFLLAVGPALVSADWILDIRRDAKVLQAIEAQCGDREDSDYLGCRAKVRDRFELGL